MHDGGNHGMILNDMVCLNIHCQKYHIGVSILLPTSRIGSFSAMKFWTISRMSDSSRESMSISFSLSNVLQLAPIPKRRRGRKCNLMFNFCSSHNFFTLFSHSQFSPPPGLCQNHTLRLHSLLTIVLMIPPRKPIR